MQSTRRITALLTGLILMSAAPLWAQGADVPDKTLITKGGQAS